MSCVYIMGVLDEDFMEKVVTKVDLYQQRLELKICCGFCCYQHFVLLSGKSALTMT